MCKANTVTPVLSDRFKLLDIVQLRSTRGPAAGVITLMKGGKSDRLLVLFPNGDESWHYPENLRRIANVFGA